jgi:hypothetical protein
VNFANSTLPGVGCKAIVFPGFLRRSRVALHGARRTRAGADAACPSGPPARGDGGAITPLWFPAFSVLRALLMTGGLIFSDNIELSIFHSFFYCLIHWSL